MNKTLLIARHEFTVWVTSKSFVIVTLLFPLLGFAAMGIAQLAQASSSAPEAADMPRVGYVDQVGSFTTDIPSSTDVVLVPYGTPEAANQALTNGDIREYVIIPPDYIQKGVVLRFHTGKELETPGDVSSALRNFLQDNLLKSEASPVLAERIKHPVALSNIRLDESGAVAADQGGVADFIIPMVFGFLLVISIGASSGTLVQGLGEEKQNRIMEVLLSSVSSRQLLLGKVLGLGGGGLVQVTLWVLSLFAVIQIGSSSLSGLFASLRVPGNVIVLGIVYFVLGYLFFAIMQAGIGAIIPNLKETPQLAVAFILPAILPFYVGILFLRDNPDHVIGTIMTLFPLTAPMSVFVRLGLTEIPPWQLALSITILALSTFGGLILAAKTFRVFLLMYGKAPKLGEIIRLLRQA